MISYRKKNFSISFLSLFVGFCFIQCAPSGEENLSSNSGGQASQSITENRVISDLSQSDMHWTATLTDPKDRDEVGGSDIYDAVKHVLKLNGNGMGTTTFLGVLKGQSTASKVGDSFSHKWSLDFKNKKILLSEDPNVAKDKTLSGELTNCEFTYKNNELTEFKGKTDTTNFTFIREKD